MVDDMLYNMLHNMFERFALGFNKKYFLVKDIEINVWYTLYLLLPRSSLVSLNIILLVMKIDGKHFFLWIQEFN